MFRIAGTAYPSPNRSQLLQLWVVLLPAAAVADLFSAFYY